MTRTIYPRRLSHCNKHRSRNGFEPETDAPRTAVARTDAPRTAVARTDAPRTDVPSVDVPSVDEIPCLNFGKIEVTGNKCQVQVFLRV